MLHSRTTSLFRPAAKAARGSGLVAVIIFSILILVLCASIIGYSKSELNQTHRHAVFLSAKNTAESIAEHGFYHVRKSVETSNDFSVAANKSMFAPGNSKAPSLPDLTQFADIGLVTSGTDAPKLAVGYIRMIPADGSMHYIDPNDQNNASDPMRGKYVFRRDVGVYSKATVASRNGQPVSVYMTETISVRASPLFAHAIFYNMDLELLPGPTMRIYGPVHTNGDMYVGSQSSSNSLNFHGLVTASGHVFHGWKSNQDGARGGGYEKLTNTAVNFYTPAGTGVNMYNSSAGWRDSTLGYASTLADDPSKTLVQYQTLIQAKATEKKDDFRVKATDLWKGNLLTKAHEVQNYTPVAIGEYKEDTTPSDGSDSSLNTSHMLIEPALAKTDANFNESIETQKYAANAGIYLTVNPSTGVITASSRVKSNLGTSKSLTIPSGNSLAKWTPYTVKKKATNVKETSVYNSKKKNYTVTKTTTVNELDTTSAGTTTTPGTPSSSTYSSSTAVTTDTTTTEVVGSSGMYDQRRGTGVDLVEVNITALKSVVTEMQKSSGSRDAVKALGNLEASDWTGIVYVEVQGGATTNTTGTSNAPSTIASNTGVRVINGTGGVPSYTGGANSERGLTIATNTALYVLGHYNADGTVTSDAGNNSAMNIETNENPAAFASDSFTVLSPDWSDAKSFTEAKQSTSQSTEISAAVLSGLMPTNKNGNNNYSGGAHNFIQFLQNHSGTVAIRGSIVALFESRMNPGEWNLSYYGPPTRQWGFSEQFKGGIYPPGTPKVTSYRRVNFNTMSAADWNAAVAAIK